MIDAREFDKRACVHTRVSCENDDGRVEGGHSRKKEKVGGWLLAFWGAARFLQKVNHRIFKFDHVLRLHVSRSLFELTGRQESLVV